MVGSFTRLLQSAVNVKLTYISLETTTLEAMAASTPSLATTIVPADNSTRIWDQASSDLQKFLEESRLRYLSGTIHQVVPPSSGQLQWHVCLAVLGRLTRPARAQVA